MAAKKELKDLVKSVITDVREKNKSVKGAKTLSLTISVYEKFVDLCKKKNLKPSNVIDEFMQKFIDGSK